MHSEIIHKSLHHTQFFKGVDRELGLGTCLIAFLVGFSGQNILSISIAVIFFFASFYYLRKLAKKMPYLKMYFYVFQVSKHFITAKVLHFKKK